MIGALNSRSYTIGTTLGTGSGMIYGLDEVFDPFYEALDNLPLAWAETTFEFYFLS